MKNLFWKIGFWITLTGGAFALSQYMVGGWEGFGLFICMMAGSLISFWGSNKPSGYWSAGNQWLGSATSSMFIATLSMGWWCVNIPFMGWLAAIALVIAIIYFLRHKCLRHNWCNDFNAWWHAEAWPALKKAFGLSMTAIKAGGAGLWTWSSGPGMSGLNSSLPVIKEILEFSLKKLLGPALIVYSAYRVYGPKWFSWALWLLILITLLTVLWKDFRDMEGKVVAAVAKAGWKQLVDTWKGAHGVAKTIWSGVAIFWTAWVGYLLHYYWDRHSSLVGFWRFLVREGYIYIIGGILLGLIIAFFLINKEYVKPGEKKPTKEEEKAAKQQESDLIKLIRKHRGEVGVAAYKKDKRAGKKFSW